MEKIIKSIRQINEILNSSVDITSHKGAIQTQLIIRSFSHMPPTENLRGELSIEIGIDYWTIKDVIIEAYIPILRMMDNYPYRNDYLDPTPHILQLFLASVNDHLWKIVFFGTGFFDFNNIKEGDVPIEGICVPPEKVKNKQTFKEKYYELLKKKK